VKIKLAIVEKDMSYLSRIVATFGMKYSDKFEIYSFTNADVALSTLNSAKIDVLLASDQFDIDIKTLPNRCGFAYLVDAADIEMLNEQRAICKFQKADLIYKQILSVYSEKASSITGFKMNGDESAVIAFCTPAGGVGSSTMAAACAIHFASLGKKTLYLNLEKFGSADMFFRGEGQFDMSDVIFAIKSKKANLSLKLESCVKQDKTGVYFYSQSRIALDMLELTLDELQRLLKELKVTGEYEYIILDLDFSMDKDALKFYRQAQAIVMVSDGAVSSNAKLERAFEALAILEQNSDAPLTNRVCLLYNRVSSKNSQMVKIENIRELGGAPVYVHSTVDQVLEQLSTKMFFDSILN
jgi:cellulose biosynthesis protein BcsQ